MCSDSEDDTQLKKFLEATDSMLLTNAMFQQCSKQTHDLDKSTGVVTESAKCQLQSPLKETSLCKSQRYLTDEENKAGADFNLPEAVQRHIAKKLTEVIANQVEFCEISSLTALQKDTQRQKAKSKVKLLRGWKSVKPYEEFEFETKGPQKKTIIKRRIVDDEKYGTEANERRRLESVAVSAEEIIAGAALNDWASKSERNDKVFQYKMAGDGTKTLHYKERINEFTQLRRRNKWNESKIKQNPAN